MMGAYQPLCGFRPRAPFLYGLGDAGFNLLWVLYDSFFLYFLVQASGLPSRSFAAIVLASRLTDLAAGTAFGIFGARLRSRFGVYRPYILWCSLPLGVVAALLFTAPSLLPAPWLWTPAYATLFTASAGVVFAALYSVANTAYTALLSVITPNATLRVRLASARFACAFLGALAVQSSTLRGLTAFGHDSLAFGFVRVTSVFAALAALLLFVSAAFTLETEPPDSPAPIRIKLLLKDFAHARQLRWFLVAMITCLIALSCRGGASPFYFQFAVHRAAWTGPALAANSLAALAVCLIVPSLPRAWIAPLRVTRLCALAGTLACLPALLWTPSTLLQHILLQVLYGAATGALLPALFALLATPWPASQALTPALQAALTLLALKAGSAFGALLLAQAAAHTRTFPHFGVSTLPPWIESFTILPSIFFAATLVCLLIAGSTPEI